MTSSATQTRTAGKATVLCADDNTLVTTALRIQIQRAPDFQWMGAAEDAGKLIEEVDRRGCPDLILLDVDMPGKSPFEAIGELMDRCGRARVLMYSGTVQRDLIERAIEAGAWGYVAKSDGESALFDAMRKVLAGEVALSPDVEAVYRA